MGKKLQNVIHFAQKEGYLHVKEDLIGDLSNINELDSDNKHNTPNLPI